MTTVFLERSGRSDVVALHSPQGSGMRKAVAEAAELRSRLDNAADDYVDGTLDREQFHRIDERLRPGPRGRELVSALWTQLRCSPASSARRTFELLGPNCR